MHTLPPLVEPTVIRDTFVSGVARMDIVGPDFYRVTFFSNGHCTFDGREERTVVARHLMAGDVVRAVASFTIKAVSKRILIAANEH